MINLPKTEQVSDGDLMPQPISPYEEISQGKMEVLENQVLAIAAKFPDAAIVGGAALRLWCSEKNLPIPVEFGEDRDIVAPKDLGFKQISNSEMGTVDAFLAKEPFVEPFFTTIKLGQVPIRISTPPRLLSRKMSNIRGELKRGGKIMEKDLLYLDILNSMVSKEELDQYFIALKSSRPDLANIDFSREIEELRMVIEQAKEEGRITTAVHPED